MSSKLNSSNFDVAVHGTLYAANLGFGLGALSNVNIAGINNGEGIAWDSGSGQFIPVVLGGGAIALNDLTDCDTASAGSIRIGDLALSAGAASARSTTIGRNTFASHAGGTFQYADMTAIGHDVFPLSTGSSFLTLAAGVDVATAVTTGTLNSSVLLGSSVDGARTTGNMNLCVLVGVDVNADASSSANVTDRVLIGHGVEGTQDDQILIRTANQVINLGTGVSVGLGVATTGANSVVIGRNVLGGSNCVHIGADISGASTTGTIILGNDAGRSFNQAAGSGYGPIVIGNDAFELNNNAGTNESIYIGHRCGFQTSAAGDKNVAIGYKTIDYALGNALQKNVLIGYECATQTAGPQMGGHIENVMIGHRAGFVAGGIASQTVQRCVVIGNEALHASSAASAVQDRVIIGDSAVGSQNAEVLVQGGSARVSVLANSVAFGRSVSVGATGVYIGELAGQLRTSTADTTGPVAIGRQCLRDDLTSSNVIALGGSTLTLATNCAQTVCVGHGALFSITTNSCERNTVVGKNACVSITGVTDDNVILGEDACGNTTTGSINDCVVIGQGADADATATATSTGRVVIGQGAVGTADNEVTVKAGTTTLKVIGTPATGQILEHDGTTLVPVTTAGASTPTFSSLSNVSSPASNGEFYHVLNGVVSVTGNITVTVAGVGLAAVDMSLPVAKTSNFASSFEAVGVANAVTAVSAPAGDGTVLEINGVTSLKVVRVSIVDAPVASAFQLSYTYMYDTT